VRALQGYAAVRNRERASFCLAKSLFGGAEMIGARVQVVDDDGGFTIMVRAESLREVEQTAKALHPGSTVSIAFPIEPECFFAAALIPTGATASRRSKV